MIVKRNLTPTKVLGHTWRPLTATVGAALTAIALRRWVGTEQVQLPFAPISMVGSAVAIFVAFRNNASYARWWEARTLWSTIANCSRILARQIVASTDNAIATGSGGSPEEVLDYRVEQVNRVIAFSHATRLTLREQLGEAEWSEVATLLPASEREALLSSINKPNMVLHRLGVRLKDGVRQGILGQFDPITLEPNVAALNSALASAERIKNTPTPRQYDYFTRLAVTALAVLVPFGLLSVVAESHDALVPILSVVVSGVFGVLERVGSIVDAPFANSTTDVPMSAICRSIERDLLEQLGSSDLPPELAPIDGYLW